MRRFEPLKSTDDLRHLEFILFLLCVGLSVLLRSHMGGEQGWKRETSFGYFGWERPETNRRVREFWAVIERKRRREGVFSIWRLSDSNLFPPFLPLLSMHSRGRVQNLHIS